MTGVLRIFPAYGLDNSLLTAVLIGLYIRFFFTEWLGWVFSGLVVPGYLGAIILLRPTSAFVIILEAILTLLIVRGMSALLSATKWGTPPFGRERFLWLVVVSVVVRVLIELVLAPLVEVGLRTRLGWDPADRFGFYGIGLVLVPLLANACWKTGLVRGSLQQLVCTALTYFLLKAVIATTNLSFADVALTFERIALDFEASPKAYLLVLSGALLASHANLRFGWDTSGVAIPGLLCLGWFTPVRLASTMAEALLIALVASLFVRLPGVRDWNIEGPRRVVLTFTIGYVLKFITVAMFGVAVPSFRATELFGLGYLLPSLLAIKIWQRRSPSLVLLPAFGLSLAGLLCGSLAGYGLMIIDREVQSWRALSRIHGKDATCGPDTTLLSEVRRARIRVAKTPAGPDAPRIYPHELTRFESMVRRLRHTLEASPGQPSCAELAAKVGPGALALRLQTATAPDGRTFYALHETTETPEQLRGFGLVALAAQPKGGPVLIVEQPQKDIEDLSAIVGLSDLVRADAIVIGGLPDAGLGRGDVRLDRNVPLRIAASSLPGESITIRTSTAPRPQLSVLAPAALAHTLESQLGPLLREGLGAVSTVLTLTPQSERTLRQPLLPGVQRYASIEAWLTALIARGQSQSLPPPSPLLELLLAEEVVRPLARAQWISDPTGLTSELAQKVAAAAAEVGFSIALVSGDGPDPRIALLGNDEGLLIAPDRHDRAFIQVASRRLGMAELGTALFKQHAAHALLTLTPKPGVVTEGLLSRIAAPILALQPPAPDVIVLHSGAAPVPACAIVSDPLGSTPSDSASLSGRLLATLRLLGEGCEQHSQYDVQSADPPSHGVDLLRLRERGEFVTLHIGPELRERYRLLAPLTPAQRLLLARLEVPVKSAALAPLLAESCDKAAPRLSTTIPTDLIDDARAFSTTRHPALIERLRARAQASHIDLQAVADEEHAAAYLLLRARSSAMAIALQQHTAVEVNVPCRGEVPLAIKRAQATRAASIKVGAP